MIHPLGRHTILPLFWTKSLPPNQAIAGEGISDKSLLSPEVFLEHWGPGSGKRHTWVSSDRNSINGLISVNGRAAPVAWHADYLMVEDEEICTELLDAASASAAEMGVRRLFVKLDKMAALMGVVRRAGFVFYSTRHVYIYHGEPKSKTANEQGNYGIRPRRNSDEHLIFELYRAAVPQSIRIAEGLTREEWRGSQEQGHLTQRDKEFVLTDRGKVAGWLRVCTAGGTGCFHIIHSDVSEQALLSLTEYAVNPVLARKSTILCTIDAYQVRLKSLLEASNFELVTEYTNAVREIAIKVREPQFAPMRA